MSPLSGALRPASLVGAVLLTGVSMLGLARAETVAPSALDVTPAAAVQPGPDAAATLKPSQAEPASTDDATPETSGPPPESDFKDEPDTKDEPVAAAPDAIQAPSDPAGAAIFVRLEDGKPLLARLPAKQREALKAFYARDGFKPVWIAAGDFTPAARSIIARLRAASEDGLDTGAYPIPQLPSKPASAGNAPVSETETSGVNTKKADAIDHAAVAEADLQLSAAALVYARDARGARINFASISKLVTPVLDLPSAEAMLPELVAAGEAAGDTLEAYNPQMQGYQGLKSRLADLRRSAEPASARLVNGKAKSDSAESADILVNMERWRWLPRDLGSDYVLVNVPEFRLRVVRGGVLRDETRVITGKPESPTPLFSGMMEYAVVNPSWYVPPSILKQMLASGKTGGFEVVRRNGQISLRQPPGERNALGFIKFMFPNQHAVYLHDTPNRSLFSNASRALSHGCVRVDDPFRFAQGVLPPEWTSEKLRKLVGKGERTIRLTNKLPVHLAYFTAYLDDRGVYRTLPDLYGYDASMKAALGLSKQPAAVARRPTEPGRRTAEMPGVAPTPRKREATRPAPRRQWAADPYRYRSADEYGRRAYARDAFGGYEQPRVAQPQPQPLSYGWW